MNKGIVIFILFNIILGAVLASFNVPILGWSSNENVFPHSVSNKYSQEQFKSLIESIVKENSVETITIFVEPKVLRTDEIATAFDSYSSDNNGGLFKFLKNTYEQSKSNIFIPHGQEGILNTIAQLKGIKGSIFVARESNSLINIKGAEMISLSEASKIEPTLSNKVVDIVVVVLAQHQDSTIKQFQTVVEKSSFASFFTSESAQEFDIKSTFDKQVEQTKGLFYSNLQNENSAAPSSSSQSGSGEPQKQHFTYVTGPVLSAYIIVALLLTILFVGICCITDLQVPDKYESPKQKVL